VPGAFGKTIDLFFDFQLLLLHPPDFDIVGPGSRHLLLYAAIELPVLL